MKLIKPSNLQYGFLVIILVIIICTCMVSIKVINTYSLLFSYGTDFASAVVYEFNNNTADSFIKFRFYVTINNNVVFFNNSSYTSYSSRVVRSAMDNVISVEYLRLDPTYSIISRDLLNGEVRASEDDKLLLSVGQDIVFLSIAFFILVILIYFYKRLL